MKRKITIFTIGHSTRSLEDFLSILKQYKINEVIDVRSIPKSRHNAQFNGPELAHELRNHHIGYQHDKDLGGFRPAHKNSINTAWKNKSFRGFADYMQTDDFHQAITKLINYAHKKTLVLMCGEAVPWRCHRSLIGDALLIHHIRVLDIYSIKSIKPHRLTPWSTVKGTTITYPA
jgi:uncharacterized protein (DUF488 family)